MHKSRKSIDAQQKALMDFQLKERPIIFSTPMVQAMIEGRKTMTRRVVKPQPDEDTDIVYMPNEPLPYIGEWKPYKWTTSEGESIEKHCPYGEIGDWLWVRETFMPAVIGLDDGGLDNYSYLYKADGDNLNHAIIEQMEDQRWKPSIHMPRIASRIDLVINNVRVERLQMISKSDAINEGIAVATDPNEPSVPLYYFYPCKDLRDDTWVTDPITSFYSLWRSINGQESWDKNPWVWVIDYRRIDL